MKKLANTVDSRITFRLAVVVVVVALLLLIVSGIQVRQLIDHGQPIDGSLTNLEVKWSLWTNQYHKLVATFWFAYGTLALFIFILLAKVSLRKGLLD